jgi:hypothetical protein
MGPFQKWFTNAKNNKPRKNLGRDSKACRYMSNAEGDGERVSQSLIQCADMCIQAEGDNFERLQCLLSSLLFFGVQFL